MATDIRNWSRSGGMSGADVCVPTDDLAAALEPLIERLNHELDFSSFNIRGGEDAKGALQIIAERSAEALNTNVECVPRRIWSIRNCEQKATNVKIADALLLACDAYIEDYPFIHLPNGENAAMEMIDAWCAENGKRMKKEDKKRLAKSLTHFKEGFLYGDRILRKKFIFDNPLDPQERATDERELELVA